MADVTKINGYIIKDANAPHPSNVGSAGQILKKTETGTEWADASFKPEGKSYLTFSSPNSFTLKVNDTTKHWNGTLEYFSSNRTWTTWDGTTTLSSVDNDGENVLYLRGTGNTVITGNSPNYRWVLTGNDIACIGNIENLLDYATVEAGNHPTMANYCYQYMFRGCTALTRAPALPATTLTDSCYYSMFYSCTSLKLSSSKTDEYTQEYRIPSSGTGASAPNALNDVFTSTGGTFAGTPEINTTYYLSSDNMVVRETEIATLNGYVGSMIDAATPKSVSATLTTSGWAQSGSGYSQTVNVTGVTTSSNGSLRIAQSATDEQFAAWGAAQPRVTAQAAGTLTVKAAGTVPAIDIPVEVLIV